MVTGEGQTLCPAGEEITFLPEYLDLGERIRLVPVDEKGRQTVETIRRGPGQSVLRGHAGDQPPGGRAAAGE